MENSENETNTKNKFMTWLEIGNILSYSFVLVYASYMIV